MVGISDWQWICVWEAVGEGGKWWRTQGIRLEWRKMCLCFCVCAHKAVSKHVRIARDKLRDVPQPVLRAAGFWQKQRFRGQRGGDGHKGVRGMEEDEKTGFLLWYQRTAMWWWQGYVRPDRLQPLIEADLESSLPLTGTDCSWTPAGRSPTLSPQSHGQKEATTHRPQENCKTNIFSHLALALVIKIVLIKNPSDSWIIF